MVQICWICSMLHLTRSCLSQWWHTISSSSSMLSSSCTTMASVTVTSRLKTASWTAAHSVSRYNSPSAAAQCYQLCWQSCQPPRYQVHCRSAKTSCRTLLMQALSVPMALSVSLYCQDFQSCTSTYLRGDLA